MDFNYAFLDGTPYDRMAQRAFQKFWNNCKYIYSHFKVALLCKNSILMRVLLKNMVYLQVVIIKYKPITPLL